MKEKVSIIVPVYNMGTKLHRCLESVMKQTYSNTEVILVNDGSTDNSYEECLAIQQLYPQVRVIHQENQGSGPARNTGIRASSGEYLYFPDADDYVEPNAIELLVDAMEGGKYDLIVFGFKNIGTDGRLKYAKDYKPKVMKGIDVRQDYSPHIPYDSEWGIQGAPWNKFFRSEIVKKYDISFPPLRRHQDEGFIARYVTHIEDVRFIPDVLYTYYSNDVKIEWDKYPRDYIDAAIGLYETRKETILSWSTEDIKAHDMISREYICNVIKALELSFSPKNSFNKTEIKKAMCSIIEKSNIVSVIVPSCTRMYQKLIIRVIRLKMYNLLYYALKLKVYIQKL